MKSSNTIISDLKEALLQDKVMEEILQSYRDTHDENEDFEFFVHDINAFGEALAEFLVCKFDTAKIDANPNFDFDRTLEKLHHDYLFILMLSMK